MHDLEPITPLGQPQPVVETHGAVTMTEVTNIALASVAARHGQTSATVAKLERILGAPPPAPGRLGGTSLMTFWMGPEQWMIEAPIAPKQVLAIQMATMFNGVASVTEQTDGWCRFDLTGDRLPDIFERMCPANTRAFRGGEAVRTTIHHIGCFVLCRTPAHVSVLGPRSSAGSLHHAVRTAMFSAL